MRIFDRLRTEKLLSFTLLLFTLSIGIVIGTLINSGVKAAKATSSAAAPDATPLVIPNPVQLSTAFTQIAKDVEPSVVNISTTYMPKQAATQNPRGRRRQVTPPDDEDQGNSGGMDDFLYRFFGGSPFGNGSPQQQRKGEAVGSGVVVDKAGYILTNNHVVDKADRIQVKFHDDSTQYEAKVIGVDPPTDLAVIKVQGKSSLVPAKIGNSDAVQVGDWAIAIGSPFNFQETVTAGIISAKNRGVDPSQQFQRFLQTDAAINPGNSGGPLLNMRGEVIGINTAIASRSGQYEGIGFALPMNTAAMTYNEIIKNGKVVRGGIGVSLSLSEDPKTPALLKAAGANEGAFVENVPDGGPADKAGIKAGDVIVGINGKPVRDGDQLIEIVTATPIGGQLNVTVLRDGKRQDHHVVVGDLAKLFPERFGNPNDSAQAKPEGTSVSFGMLVQDMTQAQRDNLSLKEKGGIQVAEVDANSFAEDIGLLKGDIIVAMNNKPINSVEDLKRLQGTLKPGDAVAFRVQRRTGPQAPWQTTFPAGTLPATVK